MFWLGVIVGASGIIAIFGIIVVFDYCCAMAQGVGRKFSFKAFLKHGVSTESFPRESIRELSKSAQNAILPADWEYTIGLINNGEYTDIKATHAEHYAAGRTKIRPRP